MAEIIEVDQVREDGGLDLGRSSADGEKSTCLRDTSEDSEIEIVCGRG